MSSENYVDYFEEETSCKGCPRLLVVFGDRKVIRKFEAGSSHVFQYLSIIFFFILMLTLKIDHVKIIQDFYCMCQSQLCISCVFSFSKLMAHKSSSLGRPS